MNSTEQFEKRLNKSKQIIDSLNWENKDFYANYLAQTYYFVCYSTRLLARSISTFSIEEENMYARFVEHIKEENYHEKIAKKDLDLLGYNIKGFEELSYTKTFWESQFFKIDKYGGYALLGYILYLEAVAVRCFDDVYKRLSKSYGDKCTKFVKVHVAEDPSHVEHAKELINSMDTSRKAIIWENFYQTADIYEQILMQILEKMTVDIKIAG